MTAIPIVSNFFLGAIKARAQKGCDSNWVVVSKDLIAIPHPDNDQIAIIRRADASACHWRPVIGFFDMGHLSDATFRDLGPAFADIHMAND